MKLQEKHRKKFLMKHYQMFLMKHPKIFLMKQGYNRNPSRKYPSKPTVLRDRHNRCHPSAGGFAPAWKGGKPAMYIIKLHFYSFQFTCSLNPKDYVANLNKKINTGNFSTKKIHFDGIFSTFSLPFMQKTDALNRESTCALHKYTA